jgi:hypothetical protein
MVVSTGVTFLRQLNEKSIFDHSHTQKTVSNVPNSNRKLRLHATKTKTNCFDRFSAHNNHISPGFKSEQKYLFVYASHILKTHLKDFPLSPFSPFTTFAFKKFS